MLEWIVERIMALVNFVPAVFVDDEHHLSPDEDDVCPAAGGTGRLHPCDVAFRYHDCAHQEQTAQAVGPLSQLPAPKGAGVCSE